jgi:WD40 repeat protein
MMKLGQLAAAAWAIATAPLFAGDTHVGPITGIAVAGGRIFSCSQGGVFEGAGEQLRLVAAPAFRVVGVAAYEVKRDSGAATALLIAGGQPGVSGSVGWGLPNTPLLTHTVAEDTVYAVAVSPDNHLVATACADGRVLVCPADALAPENWELVHRHTAAARAVAFSPDNRWLASAGLDGAVIISPLPGGREQAPIYLDDHTSGVECLAFSPNSGSVASGSRDAKVRVHQIDGKLLRTFDGLGMTDEPVAGRVPTRVLSIAWGRGALVAGTSKGTLHRLSQTDDRQSQLSRIATGPITALTFDPANSNLLVGAGELDIIESKSLSD